MKKTFIIFTLSFSAFLTNCGSSTTEKTSIIEENTTISSEGISEEETIDLSTFLPSIEGTYGWETSSDSISYDFFPDGRLHIQGPDGEATMWEGTWKVEGNNVKIVCEERNQNDVLPAKIENNQLILGAKTYTRYKAE